jgi:excalibur calcium-binding domain-containing protein
MRKRVGLVAISIVVALGIAQAPAQAAREYRNCTQLNRRFEHGVAKSRAAARREVRDGYGRPRVSRRIYRANRDLDGNSDGVACER